MATRITIDMENGSETWWDNARTRGDIPHEIAELVKCGPTDTVYVPDARAAEIQSWCESIDGWGDGPEYAPNSLLFYDGEGE